MALNTVGKLAIASGVGVLLVSTYHNVKLTNQVVNPLAWVGSIKAHAGGLLLIAAATIGVVALFGRK